MDDSVSYSLSGKRPCIFVQSEKGKQSKQLLSLATMSIIHIITSILFNKHSIPTQFLHDKVRYTCKTWNTRQTSMWDHGYARNYILNVNDTQSIISTSMASIYSPR